MRSGLVGKWGEVSMTSVTLSTTVAEAAFRVCHSDVPCPWIQAQAAQEGERSCLGVLRIIGGGSVLSAGGFQFKTGRPSSSSPTSCAHRKSSLRNDQEEGLAEVPAGWTWGWVRPRTTDPVICPEVVLVAHQEEFLESEGRDN